jgi:hypothetical protein
LIVVIDARALVGRAVTAVELLRLSTADQYVLCSPAH